MVGIGGRSKACDECRRRRIKCDLTTPECKRCLKAGLRCGGSRGLSIVQYDSNSGRLVLSSKQSPTSRATASASVGQETGLLSVTGDRSSMHPAHPWSIHRPRIYHDEIFITYTMSQLLRGSDNTAATPGTSGGLAGQCFIALSTTYFGIAHMEHDILRQGMHKYGKSLKTLNQMLGNESANRTLDVLEAIMIMALFEYLISDLEFGWIQHFRGLERLLEIRGPESMSSLPCVTLLESVRLSIVFSAILLRQNTILASEKWKTLPWVNCMERKDAMQLLIDILVDCPELFALRESIPADPDTSDGRAALHWLQGKVRNILDNLRQWKQHRLLSSWTEVPSPSTTPKTVDEEGGSTPLWETVFHFQSLYQANVMTLYHATIILVLKFCLGIQSALNENKKYQETRTLMNAAGVAICRSMDYHIERRGDDIGSLFILFPLRMAFDAVGIDNVRIGSWLKGILHKISSGSAGRWATARYLLDIQPLSNNLNSSYILYPQHQGVSQPKE